MAVDISNDAARDVEKAEQKAQKTMETAAKVAGATGHKEVEAGLRIGAKLFKVIIPVFLVLILLFLYALPTMIFETLVEFTSNIKEVLSSWGSDVSEAYSETLYSGEYGGTIASFFPVLRSAISTGASEALSGLWNSIKGIFTSDDEEGDEEEEDLTSELLVTQDEEAETEALYTKIDATKTKFESRAEDIEEAVAGKYGDFRSYIVDYIYPNDAEPYSNTYLYSTTTTTQTQTGTTITTTYTTYNYWAETRSTFGDLVVTCSSGSVSDSNCIALMAAKTVMEGASLSDMKLSDYMQWLGYDGVGGKDYTVDLEEWRTSINVSRWQGTCLPYYLVMQKAYEDETYGELKNYDEDYYIDEYGVGALDLFTIINIPSPSTITYSSITETVGEPVTTVRVKNKHYTYDATQSDIEWSEDRGYETPEKHKYVTWVYDVTTTTIKKYYYDLCYSITFRGVDDIADILGISLDENAVNEYYGIVEETTYAAAGNTEGPPETVD